jgi:hypothetical protein
VLDPYAAERPAAGLRSGDTLVIEVFTSPATKVELSFDFGWSIGFDSPSMSELGMVAPSNGELVAGTDGRAVFTWIVGTAPVLWQPPSEYRWPTDGDGSLVEVLLTTPERDFWQGWVMILPPS